MTSLDNADPGLPFVSILIPCYNAETWIAECIESALGQTYPHREIMVIDDGSTDRSVEIIHNFADRITFIRQSNAGANVARNHLTRIARGDWLQYLDADDYLLPDKITSQVELVTKRSGELDVIYSPTIIHYTAKPQQDYAVEIPDEDEAVNFIRWKPFSSHGMLLRRDAVLAVGGWKENQPCCQEHELLLRLLLGKKRFALSQMPGAVYRQHGTNTITGRDPLGVIRMRMSLTDRFEQHLKSSGNLDSSLRSALFIARMEAARAAFNWDPEVAAEFCSKAFENGSQWSASSPALPWSYRIAFRLAGFRLAELAARTIRGIATR